MPTVFANGGIIGKTLSFTAATSYTSYGNDNIALVGTAGATSTNGSISVSFDSLSGGIGSVQTDDLVIVAVAGGDTADRVMSMSTAGYTTLFDLFGNDSNDTNLGVFYKVMGATPDTSAVAGSMIASGLGLAMTVHVWRGVNTSTPIGATNNNTSGSGVLANPPAITTTVAGSTVMGVGAGASTRGAVNYTITANQENASSVSANGTVDIALMAANVPTTFVRATGTSVDPAAFTGGSSSAADSWAAATFELKPSIPHVSTLMNSGIWDTGYRYVTNTA